jgi:hypothetical protein
VKRFIVVVGLAVAPVLSFAPPPVAADGAASMGVTVKVALVSEIVVSRQSLDLLADTPVKTTFRIATNLKDQDITAALDQPLPSGAILKLTAKLPERCGRGTGERQSDVEPLAIVTALAPGVPEGELFLLLSLQRSDVQQFSRRLILCLSGGGRAIVDVRYDPTRQERSLKVCPPVTPDSLRTHPTDPNAAVPRGQPKIAGPFPCILLQQVELYSLHPLAPLYAEVPPDCFL